MTRRETILVMIYIAVIIVPSILLMLTGASLEEAIVPIAIGCSVPIVVLACPLTWLFIILNRISSKKCCAHKN